MATGRSERILAASSSPCSLSSASLRSVSRSSVVRELSAFSLPRNFSESARTKDMRSSFFFRAALHEASARSVFTLRLSTSFCQSFSSLGSFPSFMSFSWAFLISSAREETVSLSSARPFIMAMLSVSCLRPAMMSLILLKSPLRL